MPWTTLSSRASIGTRQNYCTQERSVHSSMGPVPANQAKQTKANMRLTVRWILPLLLGALLLLVVLPGIWLAVGVPCPVLSGLQSQKGPCVWSGIQSGSRPRRVCLRHRNSIFHPRHSPDNGRWGPPSPLSDHRYPHLLGTWIGSAACHWETIQSGLPSTTTTML